MARTSQPVTVTLGALKPFVASSARRAKLRFASEVLREPAWCHWSAKKAPERLDESQGG